MWQEVLAQEAPGVLTVAFLDVGQGDAIYIEAPNGNQVLIDAGKGRLVLEQLAKAMPLGDRTLDAVVATHPDLDHIGGLPDVFARYDIGIFMEPGVQDDGADYAALKASVEKEDINTVYVQAGHILALDEDVYLEVLFPDRDVSQLEANTGSVVTRLTYGDTSFLFTGDSPESIEEYMVARYGQALQSDVLKLGHHGSKTSTSEAFVGFVSPAHAVVSAGCDNRYGHPHAEVLDRVRKHGATVVGTCEHGTVTFVSDGRTVDVQL